MEDHDFSGSPKYRRYKSLPNISLQSTITGEAPRIGWPNDQSVQRSPEKLPDNGAEDRDISCLQAHGRCKSMLIMSFKTILHMQCTRTGDFVHRIHWIKRFDGLPICRVVSGDIYSLRSQRHRDAVNTVWRWCQVYKRLYKGAGPRDGGQSPGHGNPG